MLCVGHILTLLKCIAVDSYFIIYSVLNIEVIGFAFVFRTSGENGAHTHYNPQQISCIRCSNMESVKAVTGFSYFIKTKLNGILFSVLCLYMHFIT
jgi:glycopeptide antibiotics resistance protein